MPAGLSARRHHTHLTPRLNTMQITPRNANLPPPLGSLPLPIDAQRTSLPNFLSQQTDLPGAGPLAALQSDSSITSRPGGQDDLKDAFQDFVGQTFFGEMIKAFRTTQQPSKYFNGGRAEEIFQGQFDQVLSETLSDSSAEQISDPMYELFMLKRSA